MRRLIILVALLAVVGCSHGTSTTGSNGTYAPYTISTVGPTWRAHSGTVEIHDASGTYVKAVTTDSTGHGSTPLPAGTYKMHGVEPNNTLPEHDIKIETDKSTLDTVNFCPWCK